MPVRQYLLLFFFLVDNPGSRIVGSPDVVAVSDCQVSVLPTGSLVLLEHFVEPVHVDGSDGVLANELVHYLHFLKDVLPGDYDGGGLYVPFDSDAMGVVDEDPTQIKTFRLCYSR